MPVVLLNCVPVAGYSLETAEYVCVHACVRVCVCVCSCYIKRGLKDVVQVRTKQGHQ